MNQLISNQDKCKYLHILEELNRLHANIFTQAELSKYFGVSVRKISDFQNGKTIDFWLLTQYAGIIGMKINFNLNE